MATWKVAPVNNVFFHYDQIFCEVSSDLPTVVGGRQKIVINPSSFHLTFSGALSGEVIQLAHGNFVYFPSTHFTFAMHFHISKHF